MISHDLKNMFFPAKSIQNSYMVMDSVYAGEYPRDIDDRKSIEKIEHFSRFGITNCHPIPGEEVIGFKEAEGIITIHKRNCPIAIGLASQQGDSIVSVDYKESAEMLYPVTIQILAIDRKHLLSDIINCITQNLILSIDTLNTITVDGIVNCTILFGVHSFGELQTIISQASCIDGVEEVKQVNRKMNK